MNSKLHTVTDALGRPVSMFLSAGQTSDYIGARALLDQRPAAKHMLAPSHRNCVSTAGQWIADMTLIGIVKGLKTRV